MGFSVSSITVLLASPFVPLCMAIPHDGRHSPAPADRPPLEARADGNHTNTINTTALGWYAGMRWTTADDLKKSLIRVANTSDAVQGCDATAGGTKAGPVFDCVNDLVASLVAIGQGARYMFSSSQAAGWIVDMVDLESPVNSAEVGMVAFLDPQDVKGRDARGTAPTQQAPVPTRTGTRPRLAPSTYQRVHEQLLRRWLHATYGGVRFVGYVPAGHHLGRRRARDDGDNDGDDDDGDDDYLHPHAPVFRFRHPRHGLVDLAVRQRKTSSHFTLRYAHEDDKETRPTKTRASPLAARTMLYDGHTNNITLAARFDNQVAHTDACYPAFDENDAYTYLQGAIRCYTGGTWPDGSVLKIQLFDATCRTTMGYVHVGFLVDGAVRTGMERLQATETPLRECTKS